MASWARMQSWDMYREMLQSISLQVYLRDATGMSSWFMYTVLSSMVLPQSRPKLLRIWPADPGQARRSRGCNSSPSGSDVRYRYWHYLR